MAAAAHQIGRVVFEIGASDRAALRRLADVLRARFDAVVAPALQDALDRIDRPGAVIRLGRVEVDLGTLDPTALSAEDLVRRIVEGLAGLDGTAATAVRDDAEELAAFLKAGTLPWAAPSRALATLAAVLTALDAEGIARLAARLRAVLVRRRAAERLARQLPATLVRRLFRALLPATLASSLTATFGPDATPPAPSDAPAPDGLVAPLAETIHRLAVGRDMPDLGHVVSLFAALDGRTPAGFTLPTAAALGTAVRERSAPAEQAPRDAMPAPKSRPDDGGISPEAPEAEEPDDDAQPASLSVHAAGTVLLHPFLGTYFDRLGLLHAADRFRDSAARARAVLLTHYLATGALDAPEPETILFKLLCGMALTDPVPRRLHPREAERVETEALLASVIGHWKRLGTTSPAGLREGFLLRPGRLDRRSGLWRLMVEPRGIDVLLDSLPWTLSRVRTPFMQAMLVVEWR